MKSSKKNLNIHRKESKQSKNKMYFIFFDFVFHFWFLMPERSYRVSLNCKALNFLSTPLTRANPQNVKAKLSTSLKGMSARLSPVFQYQMFTAGSKMLCLNGIVTEDQRW